MTHTLHTYVETENFETDDYRAYLTRDLNWVDRNLGAERIPIIPECVYGEADLKFDPVLMKRLADAVKVSRWTEAPKSMWAGIFQQHQFLLDWLRDGELERAHDHLNLMYQSPLMIGINQGDGETKFMNKYPIVKHFRTLRNWDVFLGLVEYLGLIGPQNHEQGPTFVGVPIEDLIKNLPTFVIPPRWQGGLWCLKTSKGLFSERDMMAAYVAFKIRAKFSTNSRILEIGGGSGHVAYWLHKFGFQNIFLVDIPSVATCQAYQLAANIGAENISLANESHEAPVKFISPEQILHRVDNFDLVINCDSMPEMDKESLNGYLNFIADHAKTFYSINQESRAAHNGVMQHVVRSVIKQDFGNRLYCMDRSKFWLRDGYTEEWYMNPKFS